MYVRECRGLHALHRNAPEPSSLRHTAAGGGRGPVSTPAGAKLQKKDVAGRCGVPQGARERNGKGRQAGPGRQGDQASRQATRGSRRRHTRGASTRTGDKANTEAHPAWLAQSSQSVSVHASLPALSRTKCRHTRAVGPLALAHTHWHSHAHEPDLPLLKSLARLLKEG